jgi:hypothetical protein
MPSDTDKRNEFERGKTTSKTYTPVVGKNYAPKPGSYGNDKPTRHNGTGSPQWVHPSLRKGT